MVKKEYCKEFLLMPILYSKSICWGYVKQRLCRRFSIACNCQIGESFEALFRFYFTHCAMLAFSKNEGLPSWSTMNELWSSKIMLYLLLYACCVSLKCDFYAVAMPKADILNNFYRWRNHSHPVNKLRPRYHQSSNQSQAPSHRLLQTPFHL